MATDTRRVSSGAVKKRSQRQTKLMGQALDQTQQSERRSCRRKSRAKKYKGVRREAGAGPLEAQQIFERGATA